MSYLVFALKWRPQTFSEVVGQARAVTTLKNAISKNRLAHAYLFAGPRGVGKTTTARIVAKALNCKDGPTLTPCGKCPSCLEIVSGRSLDVLEIDGASNRGIDEIRALRENVKFAPARGKYKIYIIDEVHQITIDGFNALLKTLEEPPEFVKFIFATTQPQKVPATILSRCQRLDFCRIPVVEIIRQLEKIASSEKIHLEKDVLLAIASSSDGSLRDAESILDQLTAFAEGKILLADVTSMLGVVEGQALFALTEKILQKDAAGALNLFNEIIEQGKDSMVFLANLIAHLRNLMIAKITGAQSNLIDLPPEVCTALLKQAEAFSLEELFSIFNALANAQEMAKRWESRRIPIEVTLLKLTQPKPVSRSQPLAPNKPQTIPAQPQLEKAAEEKKQEEPTEEKREPISQISLEKIQGLWQELIANVGKVKTFVADYLQRTHPLNLSNNILVLGFAPEHHFYKESLEKKENRQIIERTLAELLQQPLKVNFILSQELSQKQEKEDLENNPFLKSALETFQGKVIKEG